MFEYLEKILDINDRRDIAYKSVKVGDKDNSFVTLKEINEADFSVCERITEELRNYLKSLSYDEVKIVGTIMLLGREGKRNEKLTGEELLNDELEYMDKVVGWNGKDEDISYILDKNPLSSYLRQGIELLNLK